MLSSSGIHANGLTLARKLAERLPQGYLSEIEPGLTYGEALLAPTTLYSPVTEALHRAGVGLHYCANITGHGWRKLMRHPAPFTYRIDSLPAVPTVLRHIQRHAALDAEQAYSTFNMGAGFAVFVKFDEASRVVELARSQGVDAMIAGRIQEGRVVVLGLPAVDAQHVGTHSLHERQVAQPHERVLRREVVTIWFKVNRFIDRRG